MSTSEPLNTSETIPTEPTWTNKGSVAIGYCHAGHIHQPFAESLIRFLFYDFNRRGLVTDGSAVMAVYAAYIPMARCTIVKKFLESKHEWLWFLDWDMLFNPQTLYALYDAADPAEKPIVGGLYFIKLEEGWSPIFYEKQHSDKAGDFIGPMREFTTGKVVPIASTGMGCTLIHRSALEKMGEAHKDDPWPWFGHDIDHGERCGEDITFFRRCAALNIPAFGHTGVLLGHQKSHVFTIMDYANNDRVTVTTHQKETAAVSE